MEAKNTAEDKTAESSTMAAYDIAAVLETVNISLYSNPEIGMKETKAHNLLCSVLKNMSFQVQEHYMFQTGFRAEFAIKEGGPRICIICEYDALPDIGHACGHNLVATGAVCAASLISKEIKDKGLAGKLIVLGTPGKENNSTKAILINNGAFEDVDVAMGLHPGSSGTLNPRTRCSLRVQIRFRGTRMLPSSGLPCIHNAMDAAVLAYMKITLSRQLMPRSWKINGVINLPGRYPCEVPGFTESEYILEAPRHDNLLTLRASVENCILAVAKESGCTVEAKFFTPALNFLSNEPMANMFRSHLSGNLSLELFPSSNAAQPLSPTDWGNVSQVVPCICPYYRIWSHGPKHTRQFTTAAGTKESAAATLEVALALASTALQVLKTRSTLKKIRTAFEEQLKNVDA
ncbi:xaa-Arg dipeptidase-like [Ornithodoros turicata]|uniref:xaa-Arg dipeptidase-like n=1 Tax=Ornithodoros turicata TaxID=34597 RepID=UPI003139F966